MDYIDEASKLTVDEIAEQLKAKDALESELKQIKHQLKWLQRQLFGQKSERRLLDMAAAGVEQLELDLGESVEESDSPAPKQTTVSEHRRKVKQRPDDLVLENGLRFDESVPVEVIDLKPEEFENNPENFDVVSVKDTYRVASRPASYLILHYRRFVVKQKQSQQLETAPAPACVFEKSYADVSLLAMVLIDKFQYHLPLYRQHQR